MLDIVQFEKDNLVLIEKEFNAKKVKLRKFCDWVERGFCVGPQVYWIHVPAAGIKSKYHITTVDMGNYTISLKPLSTGLPYIRDLTELIDNAGDEGYTIGIEEPKTKAEVK